jgi:hypothetical protein
MSLNPTIFVEAYNVPNNCRHKNEQERKNIPVLIEFVFEARPTENPNLNVTGKSI